MSLKLRYVYVTSLFRFANSYYTSHRGLHLNSISHSSAHVADYAISHEYKTYVA